jgi:hypothetical protein
MEHDSQTYRFEKDGYRYEVHHPQPEHDHDAEPHDTLLISLNGDEYTLACSPYSADAGLQCRFSVVMSEWGYIISSRSRAQPSSHFYALFCRINDESRHERLVLST